MLIDGSKISFGPEEEALLRLSGIAPLRGGEKALASINNAERFVWLANEHGTAAFVLNNIDTVGLSRILPSTDYQRLRNMALRSIARNSFVLNALNEVTIILNENGITPVLLKGTALELTIYRMAGYRPMSDADILLPREQCLKAWRVLQNTGFRPNTFKSPLHRLIPMHVGKHLPSLVKGGFSVELHHGLFWGKGERITSEMIEQGTGRRAQGSGHGAQGAEFGAQGAGHGAQGAEFGAQGSGQGENVKIPPPGLHFLYLVSHLVQHEKDGNSQLRQYNDLVAMIDFHGAEEVVGVALEYAAEVGLEDELPNKLGLLRVFLSVDLPEKYHFKPSVDAVERFVSFLGNPKGNPAGDRRVLYRETVKGIPGLHRKILYLIGDIFPGFRFMKQRYGKNSVWEVLPYYFFRIGKVLWLVKKGVKGVQGRKRRKNNGVGGEFFQQIERFLF